MCIRDRNIGFTYGSSTSLATTISQTSGDSGFSQYQSMTPVGIGPLDLSSVDLFDWGLPTAFTLEPYTNSLSVAWWGDFQLTESWNMTYGTASMTQSATVGVGGDSIAFSSSATPIGMSPLRPMMADLSGTFSGSGFQFNSAAAHGASRITHFIQQTSTSSGFTQVQTLTPYNIADFPDPITASTSATWSTSSGIVVNANQCVKAAATATATNVPSLCTDVALNMPETGSGFGVQTLTIGMVPTRIGDYMANSFNVSFTGQPFSESNAGAVSYTHLTLPTKRIV